MKGYVQDIEAIAIQNEDFRQVLYTAKNCQLVVMALKPHEEIGAEVHKLDQFFRVEQGTGEGGGPVGGRGGAAAPSPPPLRATKAKGEAGPQNPPRPCFVGGEGGAGGGVFGGAPPPTSPPLRR